MLFSTFKTHFQWLTGGVHYYQSTVKFMLNRMKLVIKRLTDQRKSYTTNRSGQLKSGLMVKDSFDLELRKFLSDYLLRGTRMVRLEQSCNITFKQHGEKMEMFFNVSPEFRSTININTFPSRHQKDLESPWRSVFGRKKGKKRPSEEIAPSNQEIRASSNEDLTPSNEVFTLDMIPQKKPCDAKSLSLIVNSLIEQSMGTSDQEAVGLMALSVAN
jgi:hypothetical protein